MKKVWHLSSKFNLKLFRFHCIRPNRNLIYCGCMNFIHTHKCPFLTMGPHILKDKVVLAKFINVFRMGWDLIWGISCFYKSRTEEAKRGRKSAIWPILCCRLSITVVSTPPCSMVVLDYCNVLFNVFLLNLMAPNILRWSQMFFPLLSTSSLQTICPEL